MKIPEKIRNDHDAEVWVKELGKRKKDDLINTITRIITKHPEAAEWILEDQVAETKSYKAIAEETEAKQRARDAAARIWGGWESVAEWSQKAEEHYGLSYDEEDEAADEGWRFVRTVEAFASYLPWEEKVDILTEMSDVMCDAYYFDWGDILYDAAIALLTSEEEREKLEAIANNDEFNGSFIEDTLQRMKR